jgi:hypothetical protein
MNTFSNQVSTHRGPAFCTAQMAAARNDVPFRIGILPTYEWAVITRSIWVVYVSEWTVWTHAVIPIDKRTDIPDPDNISSVSGLVADAIGRWPCETEREEALVVLHRSGSREISDADMHIYQRIRRAAIGRDTAPWSFHVATPEGASELTHDGEIWPDVPSPR